MEKIRAFKLNSYLLVYQNEQQIGILTMEISQKVTLNLLTPEISICVLKDIYCHGYLQGRKRVLLNANENWRDLNNTGLP